MKFITFSLLISFTLWASNMSLGPYNKEKFLTTEQKETRARTLKEAQEADNKVKVEAFHQRQKELKTQKYEAQQQRLEEEKIRQVQHEQKQQVIRDEKARKQIEANLRIKDEEERYKQRIQDDYLEKQEYLQEEKKLLALQNSEDNNLSLTPEQADITINNPDDIETELANINRLRYILLYSNKTPEFIKDYIRLLDELNKNYNIDLAFAYRGIAQAELDSSTFGGGGKYDITMRYRPTQETSIALKIDGRHQVGQYSSQEFTNEFGALTSTSASYRKEAPYLSQLWIQHTQGHFIMRAGKINPSSFIDSHLFKSNSRFFFNGTFSTSAYNSYPANGIGFTGKYERQNFYFTAEVTDANGIRDEIRDDIFTDKEFYSAIEFGITPKNGSKFHITAWHRDSSENREYEAKGFIGSAVQALDTDTHLIIRGAFSDHATAKRYASLGLGKFSLFQEHDISGIAIGTLVPSNDEDRTQTAIESFYRIDPFPGVQLSTDLQVIYHPSLGNQTWAILPGARLRILF